jgi:DNA-binding transcriptional MerR regulator
MTAIDRLRELGLKLPKTEHALASAEARRVLVVAITTEAINELLAALVEQAEGLSQATADFIASHRYGLELEKQLAAEKARADEAGGKGEHK